MRELDDLAEAAHAARPQAIPDHAPACTVHPRGNTLCFIYTGGLLLFGAFAWPDAHADHLIATIPFYMTLVMLAGSVASLFNMRLAPALVVILGIMLGIILCVLGVLMLPGLLFCMMASSREPGDMVANAIVNAWGMALYFFIGSLIFGLSVKSLRL